MKVAIRIIFLLFLGQCCLPSLSAQKDWTSFEEAQFKDVFVKEYYSFKSLLIPTDDIMALEGDEFEMMGYYIPVATKDTSLILSKTPFASCFFCGSAGQETVIDVRLVKPTSRNYIADEKIRVRGRLRINAEDWETLCFILEEAEVVEN